VTASLRLLAVLLLLSPACLAATRHYYIAAEDVTWDYAPSGRDLMHGRATPPPFAKTAWAKTRYIEYTDATFTTRKPQPEWLGILGPMIRAEVGDEVVVEFYNRSKNPHSMHPHGLRYDKNNEGAHYAPAGQGSRVPNGARFIYHWFADAGSGPGPGQGSSIVWWYHAHMDEPIETNQGLLGPIVVTAKSKARPDGSPKDVDREFVVLFMIFNELNGKDAGMFHSVNGYIFGNLPGLIMKKGEKVRWYLLGMGNEKDLHSAHWHGKTVSAHGENLDVVELMPGSMKTVDMVADNPGQWMLHCHVADHMENGMMALYTIYEPAARACPVQFVSGDFWNSSGTNAITLRNVSGKQIERMSLMSELLLAPQYLRRPHDAEWAVPEPIQAGGEQTLTRGGYLQGNDQIMGRVFFPESIVFGDGTTWIPKQEGECFDVFWRDKEHPEMLALPPRQPEHGGDD
jgi:FtsP/CotA-like multicopper oxidase with cupredoxin domain